VPSRFTPVVECHRHVTEVHLGPAQRQLAGNGADGESGAQIALGRSELAARAKEIPAPLEGARVADEVSRVLQAPNGESEQDFGGIGPSDAILFAAQDVVRDAFDAGRVGASRENQRGIGERAGARRPAREHELRAVSEGESPVGNVVRGKNTRCAVQEAKSRFDALCAATYQRESGECAAFSAAVSRRRPLGCGQGEQGVGVTYSPLLARRERGLDSCPGGDAVRACSGSRQ